MGPIVRTWEQFTFGLTLEGRRWTHVVWADGIWLLEEKEGNLNMMVQGLTQKAERQRPSM